MLEAAELHYKQGNLGDAGACYMIIGTKLAMR